MEEYLMKEVIPIVFLPKTGRMTVVAATSPSFVPGVVPIR